jgi:hypothetical protein
VGIAADGVTSSRSGRGAAAYRAVLRQWIDVTIGPGSLVGTPPLQDSSDHGSLASVVRRMACLARHDARWASAVPSLLAMAVAGGLFLALTRRHPPSVAVPMAAAAFACPLAIIPAASRIVTAVCAAAAVGRRPVTGGYAVSITEPLLTAVLATMTFLGGRRLAAPLLWPASLVEGPVRALAPGGPRGAGAEAAAFHGVGAGLVLGAVLTVLFVVTDRLLRLAAALVHRSRERSDLVVAVAAPAVEALHLLPHGSSPLDPQDKAAVLRPMRRLAANLEVTLPRLLPVSGRQEQRDLAEFSLRAGRAVRSWEPLVVVSNPDRVRMLRANLQAVLTATLNGDYADLPVARDTVSGLRRPCWGRCLRALVTIAAPLLLVGTVLALHDHGWTSSPTGTFVEALRVFAVFWTVLGAAAAAGRRPLPPQG